MKLKRFTALLCVAALMFSFTGCGNKEKDTEASTETAAITMDEIMDGLNVDELVTKLADYSNLEYELTNDYTVDDSYVTSSLEYILSQRYKYVEVTNRDTIKDGDYVLVDYTGYLDGEAFANGAAENQYIWVSENNGYIPGFTDGLVGQKVGTTVTNDVTFPDPYENNTDLSGKETQFEFVIKGIYSQEQLGVDNVTDQDIVDNFSSYSVSNLEELRALVKEQAEYQADYYRRSEVSDYIVSYLVENSEVTIPEEYLSKRIQETIDNGSTEDEESLKETLSETIKQEILILKISQDLGVYIDEDEYATAVSNLAAQNYLDSAASLYLTVGNQDAKKGEIQVRRWYLMNEALNKLVDQTNIKELSSTNS